MKRVSVLVVGLVVALCVALPLAGCSANEYTPTAKDQTVNDSALNTAGTLRVGVNASNAPYSCESSGSIVGIDVDIAAALADEMGLKLELVDVGTGSDTAFTKDNVDIVMGVTKSNSAYWMSDTYLSSGVALFSLTQGAQAPTAGGGFKVAAQSSSMSAIEVENHYGASCLDAVADPQSAFEALKTGTVNYVASDTTIGEYVVHTTDVQAYPIALLASPQSYAIAVSSSNTTLQKAVEAALTSIKGGGVIDVIQKSWLGDQADISTLNVIAASQSSTSSDTSSDQSATDSSSSDTSSDNTDASASDSSSSGSSTSNSSSGSSTSSDNSSSGTSGSTSTRTSSTA